MTTWTEVSDESTSYEHPADVDNRYVAVGYVQNGYLLPEAVWSSVSSDSTSWA